MVAYKHIYFFTGLLVLLYVPKLIFIIFHFIEDVIHYFRMLHFLKKASKAISLGETLPPQARMTLISEIGIVLAIIPFASIVYGISEGKFNFKVKSVELFFPNLPSNFDGMKIVQISDFHIGSFYGDKKQIEAIVDLVNEQDPDILVFTGDMVNYTANEMDSFMSILSGFNAKLGKYAILGNHDYGDYQTWQSDDMKENDHRQLMKNEQLLGFKLLLNENVKIRIDNNEIALIGVENWGLPPYSQYGNLDKAMKGVENIGFKLLLSHDPTFWDAKVIKKTDIDLTLSGHTHGMQFGFRIPGLKWSPAKYKYPRWSGLYQVGKQYLYVNVGLGFFGFPGRIGMPPEITVIKLRKRQ